MSKISLNKDGTILFECRQGANIFKKSNPILYQKRERSGRSISTGQKVVSCVDRNILLFITIIFNFYLLVWITFFPLPIAMHMFEVVSHYWLPYLSSLYCMHIILMSFSTKQCVHTDCYMGFGTCLLWPTIEADAISLRYCMKILIDLISDWKVRSMEAELFLSITHNVNDFIQMHSTECILWYICAEIFYEIPHKLSVVELVFSIAAD